MSGGRPTSAPSASPLERHTLKPAEHQLLIAAELRGSAFLVFRDSEGVLSIFELPAGESVVAIGRSGGASLCLPWDGRVSVTHAEVRKLGDAWILDDRLSRNGTFVNDQRLVGRQRLRDRDRIRVGRTVIAFRDPSEQAAATMMETLEAPVEQLSDTQRRILVSLCRPLLTGNPHSAPAPNHVIASEVHLGIDAVKANLKTMFVIFGVRELPQNQKRAALAAKALLLGIVSEHDA